MGRGSCPGRRRKCTASVGIQGISLKFSGGWRGWGGVVPTEACKVFQKGMDPLLTYGNNLHICFKKIFLSFEGNALLTANVLKWVQIEADYFMFVSPAISQTKYCECVCRVF